jgi:hypothetical protein
VPSAAVPCKLVSGSAALCHSACTQDFSKVSDFEQTGDGGRGIHISRYELWNGAFWLLIESSRWFSRFDLKIFYVKAHIAWNFPSANLNFSRRIE